MIRSHRAIQAAIVMRQWTDRWRTRTGVHPGADVVVPHIRRQWPELTQAEFDYVFQNHERSHGMVPQRAVVDSGRWK